MTQNGTSVVNEYNLPKIPGVLSMTKLKNRIGKLDPDLVCHLKNIRVNGQLRGCSGFVTHPRTQKIAYLNTESGSGQRPDEAYYRSAESERDYRGGVNHFCDVGDLPSAVVGFLS